MSIQFGKSSQGGPGCEMPTCRLLDYSKELATGCLSHLCTTWTTLEKSWFFSCLLVVSNLDLRLWWKDADVEYNVFATTSLSPPYPTIVLPNEMQNCWHMQHDRPCPMRSHFLSTFTVTSSVCEERSLGGKEGERFFHSLAINQQDAEREKEGRKRREDAQSKIS